MTFKIEIRKTCKVCKNPLPKRFRTYCSTACRNKFFNKKYREYGRQWQINKRNEIADKPSPRKVQCLICGRWYVQVCTHIVQVHGLMGRQYREYFDLERKRGVVPLWYRQFKGDQALNNLTYKNLKVGKKFWFSPGDKRAGKYKRSHITLERLKNLHKLNKYYAIRRQLHERV
jgi:hypothetical protein